MLKTEDRNGVQSVEIAGTILAAMTEAGMPLPLKDLARRTGLSPAKVHRYLVSLARCDLVRQDADSGRYGIGAASIALGLRGLASTNAVKCAMALLPTIRDEVGETAVMAVWSSAGPVIVSLEESSRQIFMNIRVGSILPIMRSAVGRVFAAYLPPLEVAPLLQQAAKDAGWAADAIEAILATTRHHGVGRVTNELVPGVSALAAPVLDHRGQIAACVGVLGRSVELDVGFASGAAATLQTLVLRISREIGYVPASEA